MSSNVFTCMVNYGLSTNLNRKIRTNSKCNILPVLLYSWLGEKYIIKAYLLFRGSFLYSSWAFSTCSLATDSREGGMLVGLLLCVVTV